jgi:hypothetical protein
MSNGITVVIMIKKTSSNIYIYIYIYASSDYTSIHRCGLLSIALSIYNVQTTTYKFDSTAVPFSLYGP